MRGEAVLLREVWRMLEGTWRQGRVTFSTDPKTEKKKTVIEPAR